MNFLRREFAHRDNKAVIGTLGPIVGVRVVFATFYTFYLFKSHNDVNLMGKDRPLKVLEKEAPHVFSQSTISGFQKDFVRKSAGK